MSSEGVNAAVLLKMASDTRKAVNQIRYDASNQDWVPHDLDAEDMEYVMMSMSNGIHSGLYVLPKPSVRAFDSIDAARNWFQTRDFELPTLPSFRVPDGNEHRVREKTLKFYNVRGRSTLSRRSVIVVEMSDGARATYANIRTLDKLPRGTVIPIFGCIDDYETVRNSKRSRTKKALGDLPSHLRCIGCNSLDCPVKQSGEWSMLDADPERMFNALLRSGPTIDPTRVFLPDSFTAIYKQECDRMATSLTEERMHAVFKMHKTECRVNLSQLREAVCREGALLKLLDETCGESKGHGTHAICRTFQMPQRRFLQQELSRIMLATGLRYADDPNALVVTHVSREGQLRAYAMLTKTVGDASEIRLYPSVTDQI